MLEALCNMSMGAQNDYVASLRRMILYLKKKLFIVLTTSPKEFCIFREGAEVQIPTQRYSIDCLIPDKACVSTCSLFQARRCSGRSNRGNTRSRGHSVVFD